MHAHISITNYTQSHLNHFTCITSPFICLWRHKITWQYCSVSGQYIKYQHRKTAHQIPAQDNKFVLIHPHSIFIYTNQNFQKEKKYWINKNIKSSAHQLKTVHKRQKHIIHNHAIKLPVSWSSIFFNSSTLCHRQQKCTLKDDLNKGRVRNISHQSTFLQITST